MVTYYDDLSPEEQEEIEDELADDPDTLDDIKDGHLCAECYMVWYNCLCSHDN